MGKLMTRMGATRSALRERGYIDATDKNQVPLCLPVA